MCSFHNAREHHFKIKHYMTDDEVKECAKFYNETEEWVRKVIEFTANFKSREENLLSFQKVKASEPSQEWLEAAIACKHKPIVIKAKGEK